MHYLKERAMVVFYLVIVIDSERWYPATIETDQTLPVDINSASLWNDTQSRIQNYLPLLISKYENRTFNKSKWHFSQQYLPKNRLITRNDANQTDEPLPNTIAYQPYVSFVNSTSSRNVYETRPARPRRKVSKICPSARPRKNKQRFIDQTNKRKFLEVFEVVQFEHVLCTSSSGLEGTCLHEYDCHSAGGSPMGSCADGYATCCVIQFVCDGRSSSSVGWFTNPGFPTPSTDRISCTITLDKSSVDIQQIRLDFLVFEMLPPSSGSCEDDQFVVSGQNTNNLVPILCGINTGQHVYIEVDDAHGPVFLSIQTVIPEKRLYAIKITQLSKSDELAAPKGCLQYYKDDQGYLESFNYRDNSDIGISRHPGYLNNLNYAMCMKRAAKACSITYNNAGELQIPNYDTDGLPVIPPRQAGVEIFNCPSDWLLISAIRLCGERLNDGSVLQDFSLDAPVTDSGAGPLVIWFRSDGGYVGRGFKLDYKQNTCTVST